MRATLASSVDQKKPYVKPQLLLHGSVQKLTEKLPPVGPDCGSNIRFPSFNPPGKSKLGGW